MFWYKHSTGSHDDPDISDAWDELGDFGYVGFFVILEIYGQEFSHRDSEDFINISATFLRRKLRKSLGKVQLLLDFFQKRNRIISKLNGDRIQLKVPKYIELASNWTKRLPTEAPTEAPTAKDIDIEVDKEEEKKKNKKKENKKEKKLFGESVLLTDEEYQKLCDKFTKPVTDDWIIRLNEYAIQKSRKFKEYTSHYITILHWDRLKQEREKTQRKGVDHAEEWNDTIDKRKFPVDIE